MRRRVGCFAGRVVMRRAPNNWNVSQRMKFDGQYQTMDPLLWFQALAIQVRRESERGAVVVKRSIKRGTPGFTRACYLLPRSTRACANQRYRLGDD